MGKSNGSSGKQSALKRLRSSLSAAGLTGPKSHVSKKDKKRGVTKSSGRQDDRKQKLKAIQSAMNPFEMQVNRKKLSVLGLKRKDEQVNVAVARQKAVEKRKATIGIERKNRNKAGAFIDRRIGENDVNMDPEEKMLQRFTLERQKRSRNSAVFNLEDGDEDVEGAITSLTHFGQSLDDMDKFDDMAGSDDEGNGAIDRDTVAGDHFGGFEESGPARKKTKAEVMQEVIAKSKQFKHERQLAKEQDDEMRQELDDDFAAVRALLFDGDESSKPMMKAADGDGNDLDVSYDAAVRELIFEQRARPQDRLKTEDEVIREEKEKLERAERHRQRRMDGLPSDSEPESDDDEGALKKGYDAQSKRAPEADDLGDDFAAADSDEEDNGAGAAGIQLGAGLGADESEDEEDSEEGSDEEEDSGSEDDDEGTDLGDSDSEAEPVSKKAIRPTKTAKVSAASKTTDDALPFTFPAPADYDQWLEIIGDYTLDQQLVVIKRLRTLYHIRLSPQNKEKLSNLCVVLLEHFAVLAEQDPPVPMPVIDEISKHIGELISIDVDRIGEHCRQTVIEIHMRIAAAIKGASGTTEKHMAAPAAMRSSDVALMRLFVSLFSSSDRYNSVITPLLVAMCQFLSQYTFTELNDFTAGLILVGIIHETQRLSRRFVPETLNFLFATLSACVCDPANAKDWHGQFPLSRRQREAYGSLRISEKSATVAPVTWAWLFDTSDEAEISAAQKLGILRSCLVLARKYIDVYFSTPAFIELFTPLQSILAQISDRAGSKMAPKEIVELTGEVASYLDSQLEQAHASRTPLKMQYHKPLAIQSIAPKFESNYSIDAHYDPNHDRNEILKLRRQVNKEKRGAVRELRRDAQFIQAERLKEMREKDKTYADKMKKAWGVLENDQSEMKKLDKLRIKERKAKIE